jgi:hypothetical protein
MPIVLTKMGSWKKYFIGIAKPSNRRREVPSRSAINLKNFNI